MKPYSWIVDNRRRSEVRKDWSVLKVSIIGPSILAGTEERLIPRVNQHRWTVDSDWVRRAGTVNL